MLFELYFACVFHSILLFRPAYLHEPCFVTPVQSILHHWCFCNPFSFFIVLITNTVTKPVFSSQGQLLKCGCFYSLTFHMFLQLTQLAGKRMLKQHNFLVDWNPPYYFDTTLLLAKAPTLTLCK